MASSEDRIREDTLRRSKNKPYIFIEISRQVRRREYDRRRHEQLQRERRTYLEMVPQHQQQREMFHALGE